MVVDRSDVSSDDYLTPSFLVWGLFISEWPG